MATADETRVSFGGMEGACTSLNGHIEQLQTLRTDVQNIVNTFQDAWSGTAKDTFVSDYDTILTSIDSASEAMIEITHMLQGYLNDMQELENKYGGSGPHVTIG